MRDVRTWLEAIGLAQYADAFEANEIDMDLLRRVNDQALKDIGVFSTGHRLRLHSVIAELSATPISRWNADAAGPPIERHHATAERRQVAVLFPTSSGRLLSTRMDPDDLREVISAYQKCVAETVRRYDGFVAKYPSDGALVHFG